MRGGDDHSRDGYCDIVISIVFQDGYVWALLSYNEFVVRSNPRPGACFRLVSTTCLRGMITAFTVLYCILLYFYRDAAGT